MSRHAVVAAAVLLSFSVQAVGHYPAERDDDRRFGGEWDSNGRAVGWRVVDDCFTDFMTFP